MKISLIPACLFLLVATAAAVQSGHGVVPDRTESNSSAAESEAFLFAAINRIRSEHGLAPLERLERLTDIARAHSRDMAKRGTLGHTDSGGRDIEARIAAAGIKGWRMIGENVGRSFGRRDNAEILVSIWMDSMPHRENILSRDFNRTGIGTATAMDGTLYATQVFMGIADSPPGASDDSSRRGMAEKQPGLSRCRR